MISASEAIEDEALRAALAHPLDGPCLALSGPAGTGKTFALLERAEAIASAALGSRILLCAPSEAGVIALRSRARNIARSEAFEIRSLAGLAFETLRFERAASGSEAMLELVDDGAAAALFEDACTSLFSMEWPELAAAQIDPEVTGLRSPQRFAAAAFRLIRKLRAGLITPEAFRTSGLRGSTEFYGRPPNFASSDLIRETADKYRNSLRVSQPELDRQRTREVDLVLILAKLYELYGATIAEHSFVTEADALYDATFLLRGRGDLGRRLRSRFAYAAIDDAQDLTGAQLGFLAAIYGDELRGVTLAGDGAQGTCGFSNGGRGADAFKSAAVTVAFEHLHRSPAIERIARIGLDPLAATTSIVPSNDLSDDGIALYRADDTRDEVRFIVGEVRRLIAGGTPAREIALVTRHLDCAHAYIDALLAHDVPVDAGGVVDLYEFPAVLDALAVLWSSVDPFRHDFLMRNFEAPWMRLSDASIATLCGEARDPQPLLFELPGDEEDEARAGRWDRKRDLRLGRNVTRGDVDVDLSSDARERLGVFRAARERWADLARTLGPADLARTILGDSVLATLPANSRERFDTGLIARLLARIEAYERRERLATLHDFLLDVDRMRHIDAPLPALERTDLDAVAVLDVEAAKGYEFEAVFVPDLHAGAWPRYYVPDAFLFMPKIGMIAKENVGDAASARTAKFTYALYRYKFREKYNDEERRAFYSAATRARKRLFVSAPGRATRGVSAPELLAELEKKR